MPVYYPEPVRKREGSAGGSCMYGNVHIRVRIMWNMIKRRKKIMYCNAWKVIHYFSGNAVHLCKLSVQKKD